ncbi:hypothetical protein HPP92_004612 [Vanilla planifolia]|uniref:Thaumatin-like protein n=1 Tax=Vanilla planifolia TaxID=51239 RepID=A0A835RTF3_VANPL|nr:hypothetical protein HPP92_004965 [Vanilla planifolia]KAG0493618.1 hypothetical protein HPP92_004612 [Vanilla planifolia]
MAIARFLLLLFFAALLVGCQCVTFTIKNSCTSTIWPATLNSGGSPQLTSTGFELAAGNSTKLLAPPKWSGRMWARTHCSTDASGRFSCLSGDCGTGQVSCSGSGGAPPVSLAEFTLDGADDKDFYDISLVDGFNLPVAVAPDTRSCNSTVCPTDVNQRCPEELKQKTDGGEVIGCKSPCLAFGGDRYCCTGVYNNPKVCKPTDYSTVFKKACPQAYSYPYDDATSTFTCVGSNYLITFCPSP